MDPARPQPALRNLKPTAFAQYESVRIHLDAIKVDDAVAVWRIVVSKHCQMALHRHALCVPAHQNHRMLLVKRLVVRIVHAPHHNQQLASRVHHARDPPFTAIELVAAIRALGY